MENSDDNDKETDKHAMVESSAKSGPETPKQTMKTSDESDQETSRQAKKKKSDVCKICHKSFSRKHHLKEHI